MFNRKDAPAALLASHSHTTDFGILTKPSQETNGFGSTATMATVAMVTDSGRDSTVAVVADVFRCCRWASQRAGSRSPPKNLLTLSRPSCRPPIHHRNISDRRQKVPTPPLAMARETRLARFASDIRWQTALAVGTHATSPNNGLRLRTAPRCGLTTPPSPCGPRPRHPPVRARMVSYYVMS